MRAERRSNERGHRTAGKITAVAAGTILLAACESPQTTGKSSTFEGPIPTSSASQPSQKGHTPPPHSKELVWPGADEAKIPFPGRVALPDETCMKWGLKTPQPNFVRNGRLFAVIDARRSYPPDCDYEQDKGAGTYKGASYLAEAQPQPDGEARIPNGTVVEVTGYALGQRACNDTGATTVWIRYSRTEEQDSPQSWSSIINVGGGPDQQTLVANKVPELPSSYAGTVHANC